MRPPPSSAARTEPADVPTMTSASCGVEALDLDQRVERPDRPGRAEHAARAEHQPAPLGCPAAHQWVASSSSAERVAEALGEHVDVGHRVAVGVEAVEDLAVVRRQADAQGLPLGQRDDRVGGEHPRLAGVERLLRAGHVGDHQVEPALGQAARDPGAERVQGRRGEAGQPGQRLGADRLAGLLVRLHPVGDLVQPHDRAGLPHRQVDQVARDPVAGLAARRPRRGR